MSYCYKTHLLFILQHTKVMTPFFPGAPWYRAIFKNLCVSDSPINRATLFVTELTTMQSVYEEWVAWTVRPNHRCMLTFDAQHGWVYNKMATVIKDWRGVYSEIKCFLFLASTAKNRWCPYPHWYIVPVVTFPTPYQPLNDDQTPYHLVSWRWCQLAASLLSSWVIRRIFGTPCHSRTWICGPVCLAYSY